MHAKWLEHSELETHSGRQFGGDPMNSFKHEHDGVSPTTLHCEFGPQGDGRHGSRFSTSLGGSTMLKIEF